MKLARIVALLFISLPILAQQPFTFDDMMKVRRVGVPRLSPDSKWIAYDVSTVDLEANRRTSAISLLSSGGGMPLQITDGKHLDDSPVFSPDGKSIAYLSNRHGGARQIYVYDLARKSSRKVSDLTNGAGSVRWLPDGSGFVAVSDVFPDCGVDPQCAAKRVASQDGRPSQARIIEGLMYRHWNMWVPETTSQIVQISLDGTPRALTSGMFDTPPFSLGGPDAFDISPDGRELAFTRNTDPLAALSTNSDIFIVPVAGGAEPKRITTRRGADTTPRYSPDGKWIAYRSQAREGFEADQWELHLYERGTGRSMRIANDFASGAESIDWAGDSKSLIITARDEKRNSIYEIAVPFGTSRRIYGDGSSDGVQLSRNGRTIYFQNSTLSRPAEIFSVARSGGAAKQVTHENDRLLSNVIMGEVSDLWYAGADDTRVQTLLVKPPRFDPSRKYPALVLIHGGPQSAWTDSWGYRWNPQIFASAGYVVLMPNPRGSTGYGQRFTDEISRDWGGKVYVDLMKGVDELAKLPYVDETRLAAAGASYGGYMVNWILGHSDRFKALVSHAGVFNLDSMYGVTEELWFPEWEFGGNPWDNPELYEKWSPHRYAKYFKTPTLVTHGELDFRVPVGEGMQLFTALQRRGVPSKLILFPDEGHWILKPQNSKLWYTNVIDWLNRYTKDQ